MSAHFEFAQTDKQAEIMRLVLTAVDHEHFLTLEKLREQLSYKPSKQAVLCSLKILESHGFLTKVYHGNRSMELKPTTLAYTTFRSITSRI